ncbi:hypothetical protein ACSBM8_08155 [Sphingomonas sp. ASY06-1R]|jgi:hypothetical protein|uniref:hypothetical protein n=1 Tax=Sphingomonas sp. ASY06-1R TaxID=3445771 RepID=UPI003FA2AF58
MRQGFRAALLLAITSAAQAAPIQSEDGWTTWRNARFGFSICYPGKVFPTPRESEAGHAIAMESKDSAQLIAGGIPYARATLAEPIRMERERLTHVALVARGENWFVVSGTRVDQILYTKAIKVGDRLIAFRFRYPQSLAVRYAPMVERISHCLKVAGHPS